MLVEVSQASGAGDQWCHDHFDLTAFYWSYRDPTIDIMRRIGLRVDPQPLTAEVPLSYNLMLTAHRNLTGGCLRYRARHMTVVVGIPHLTGRLVTVNLPLHIAVSPGICRYRTDAPGSKSADPCGHRGSPPLSTN
jgi:hypothetical protein